MSYFEPLYQNYRSSFYVCDCQINIYVSFSLRGRLVCWHQNGFIFPHTTSCIKNIQLYNIDTSLLFYEFLLTRSFLLLSHPLLQSLSTYPQDDVTSVSEIYLVIFISYLCLGVNVYVCCFCFDMFFLLSIYQVPLINKMEGVPFNYTKRSW